MLHENVLSIVAGYSADWNSQYQGNKYILIEEIRVHIE
jgi:hypothetical protein